MWCTHLTWKMLGQPAPKCWLSKTMMLVNVCACFDVMISHGWPANLPRRCSFFLSVSLLFSYFSLLQCFWPCPFFFLQGPMLSWKVIIWIVLLNLHGATRSTRSCTKRASLFAWLSFFLQHVGQHRSKNDHDEEIKSQIFYWNCYMYCCERQGRKFQALRETKNAWNFFVIEPIAAPSARSFLPGVVNLAKPS